MAGDVQIRLVDENENPVQGADVIIYKPPTKMRQHYEETNYRGVANFWAWKIGLTLTINTIYEIEIDGKSMGEHKLKLGYMYTIKMKAQSLEKNYTYTSKLWERKKKKT